MAAGLGFKDFQTGEVLTAADVDGYLMQGVWVFASATARDAAVTSPQEGNFAYLKDTNVTTYYTGSAWANLDTTGMTNPMTTTGDTIYSSSGSTPARLGIGTTGQVLTVAAGVPSWATPTAAGITYSTWSPTFANFSIGNGTANYRYAQSGKAVFLDINITFGSTTTIGEATISLPVAPKYVYARVAANYFDAGTAFYSASATIENSGGTDLLSLKAQKSDATYTTLTAVNATVPFTWTTNDQINIQCVYEAA